jgi:hypothetical protein
MRLTWDKVTFQTPEHMLPTPCSVPPAPRVARATTLALIEKHVQPELATFYPRASEVPSNNARVRTMPSASAIYACAVLDRQGLTSSELCKQRRQDAARAKDWARTSTYDPRWIPAILGLGLTISSTRPAETETVPQVEEDPLLQPTPSTSAVKMEDTAQSSQKLVCTVSLAVTRLTYLASLSHAGWSKNEQRSSSRHPARRSANKRTKSRLVTPSTRHMTHRTKHMTTNSSR